MMFQDMDLIFWSNEPFSLDLVFDVTNRERFIKPRGGLWTSPLLTEYGWKEWCEAESYGSGFSDKIKTHIKFRGSVLVIDSVDDLSLLPWINDTGFPWISFEELAKEYDAVHLTVKGERETRFSSPLSLHGWDCETVLILNKPSIYEHWSR